MKLVVAPEAAAQIVARKHWWRANRSKAPERFDEELAVALTAISERPESFPVFSARPRDSHRPIGRSFAVSIILSWKGRARMRA
jgi:hypothetical protein